MNSNLYLIITLVLKALVIGIVYFLFPLAKNYFKVCIENINANTTETQRKNLKYWCKIGIYVAENLFKIQGQGEKKKNWVKEFLKNSKLHFTEEQADGLIDVIVDEFNKNGWEPNKALEEIKEVVEATQYEK